MSVAFQASGPAAPPRDLSAARPAEAAGSPAAQAIAARPASRFLQLLQRLSAKAAGEGAQEPAAGRPKALSPRSSAAEAGRPAAGRPQPVGTEEPRAKPPGGEKAAPEPAAAAGDPKRTRVRRDGRPGEELQAAAAASPARRGPLAAEAGKAAGSAAAGASASVGGVSQGGRNARSSVLPAEDARSKVSQPKGTQQAQVVVVDLRRQAPTPETEAARQRGGEERETGAAKDFGRVLAGRDSAFTGESPRPVAAGQSPPGLWRSVQERLLPEIVQRTGIILRDGGEGEIRLVLRPEHLGSVRIRLHLGESSLEGRIVVDNYNVKELLEANLEQLKTALRQEGYASANIDVSVSGDGTRGEAGRNETGLELAGAGRQASEFERTAPLAWEAGLGFTTVNLFV